MFLLLGFDYHNTLVQYVEFLAVAQEIKATQFLLLWVEIPIEVAFGVLDFKI